MHGVCDAEGDGEDDKAHRIVERDDRQKQIDKLTLGLVLAHDHQCGCGRRGGGDGAEDDGLINADDLREAKVEDQQRGIDQHRGDKCLRDADDGCLTAGFFEGGKAEFVADGERDEAEGNVGDDGELVDRVHRDKAEAVKPKLADAVRADQNTGDQIGGHGRQTERLKHAGHQQTCKGCNG